MGIICDCCGEEFEESFFCEKCSNQYIGTELEEVPDIRWNGVGDGMVLKEVDQYSGMVCKNCCECNT